MAVGAGVLVGGVPVTVGPGVAVFQGVGVLVGGRGVLVSPMGVGVAGLFWMAILSSRSSPA